MPSDYFIIYLFFKWLGGSSWPIDWVGNNDSICLSLTRLVLMLYQVLTEYYDLLTNPPFDLWTKAGGCLYNNSLPVTPPSDPRVNGQLALAEEFNSLQPTLAKLADEYSPACMKSLAYEYHFYPLPTPPPYPHTSSPTALSSPFTPSFHSQGQD